MLKIVSNRLAPLVIKEYSSIMGVKKDLQEFQTLVEEINYWLESTGDKTMGSGPPLRWLKLLKDVTYDVDDIIDEFHLEAEKHETDGDIGKHVISKYLCRKPTSLLLQCKTAHKIRAIKNRLAAIVRQRTNISAIVNSLPVGHSIRHIVKTTGETASLPIVDATSVIGRDQEKQQIISKLLETQGQRKLKIVSIIGLGGSGKTTLANLVFNDFNIVEKHFGARLWVHVSQEFVIESLIKKLFESIADKDPGQHALPYMTKRIKEELTGKRFLLVLDDVWTESRIQWEDFMVHLNSGAPRSRILITARSRKVAETVGSSDQLVSPFLSPDDSWQLFQQSLVIPAKGLELEYVEVGKEIVRKCGGIPLAIKALAGVLYALPNSTGNNKKLRVLGLGHTRIERLPSRIITLGNLEYLDLRWCKSLVDLPEGIENLQKLQLLNLDECDNLRAMPIGIGRLNRLQNPSIFIVGKDETAARILELGNIARNSVNLTIRGIVHALDPNDAYKAYLEQKTNLQRLQLNWGRSDADGMNIELEHAVLDGLEPPLRIKELYIRQYADLPNLKDLKGLVKLPCLEDLRLLEMPSLESISGGPFPSLVKLKLFGLPSLKEMWMVTASTLVIGDEEGSCSDPHQLGQVLIGTRLSHLEIERCPKLMVKPYLPLSLEKFTLFRSNEQLLQSLCLGQGSSSSSSCLPSFSFCHLRELELWYMTAPLPPPELGSERGWELLQHMTALESLHICKCDSVAELPESMRSLTSLQSLCIDGSSAIHVLPEWLGELRCLQKMIIKSCDNLSRLPQSMGYLTCLQVLRIEWCDALDQLPECLGQLCSLRKFVIQHLRGLTCLPQCMCRLNSLEQLVIHDCPGIKSLPEGIKDLTALQQVDISCCPDLGRRCKREKGEDWHLISAHISHLVIC
ncbi:hypothetical protein PR202_gb00680 [Eleusine coracana subsp. coracana]|uniref:Uncharacterized protein n=1 Tax=Eleusine coracana subsp. coracana TaxID=191504 RepID=A0AAV5DTQ2_ELECO|nr:hypothetical protein PR202_gb00680 [Eleusine coracana subsp. coracana]